MTPTPELEAAVERLKEATDVVRDLLEVWPSDSVPPHALCLRAADVVNTPVGYMASRDHAPGEQRQANLHPATAALVDRFAAALKAKLAAAEQKYGYSDGWLDANWQADLREKLYHHVNKGDPRDVAAYCAFAWHHGWSVAPQDGSAQSLPTGTGEREGSPWDAHLKIAEEVIAHLQENVPAFDAYDEDEVAGFETAIAMIVRGHLASPSSTRSVK